MRKVIASINMTLDGFWDHTAMIADNRLSHVKNIRDQINLKLLKTKALGSGVVILYNEPIKN